ncbi:glycosyltransferase family 4 protein [Candidatus Kaiserbacteria bacterium]|nr:glycosyltransferase family 4 protein [Candidatus Kaiserbacteria bacterium]
MHILITTGIFEPESGGPATYTPRIAEKLVSAGHTVTVVTYADRSEYDFDGDYPFRLIRVVRKKGKLLNYLRFLKVILPYVREVDFVYSLDWLAAGLPVALATKIYRKKYVVRVGGGYIWEKYLEGGSLPMSLKEFYRRGLHRKYLVLFSLIRFVLRGAAHVIFNTKDQARLFGPAYKLRKSSVSVIENPVLEVEEGITRTEATKEIIFAGRLIVMKNVESLILAFKRAQLKGYTLSIIGDGPRKEHLRELIAKLGLEDVVHLEEPLRQKDLYERIKNCAFVVIPSWTDISPNQAYELLAYKIPFVITKENYLSIRDQFPVTIDPHSVQDMMQKLQKVTKPGAYRSFVSACAALQYVHTWDDVLEEHLAVFETL